MRHDLRLMQKGILLNRSRYDIGSRNEMPTDVIKKISGKLRCQKVDSSSLGSCGSTKSGESGDSLNIDSPCSIPASVSRALAAASSKVRFVPDN